MKYRFRRVVVPAEKPVNLEEPNLAKVEKDLATMSTVVVQMDPTMIRGADWDNSSCTVTVIEPLDGPADDRPYGRLVRRPHRLQGNALGGEADGVLNGSLSSKTEGDIGEVLTVAWPVGSNDVVATVWRPADTTPKGVSSS